MKHALVVMLLVLSASSFAGDKIVESVFCGQPQFGVAEMSLSKIDSNKLAVIQDAQAVADIQIKLSHVDSNFLCVGGAESKIQDITIYEQVDFIKIH